MLLHTNTFTRRCIDNAFTQKSLAKYFAVLLRTTKLAQGARGGARERGDRKGREEGAIGRGERKGREEGARWGARGDENSKACTKATKAQSTFVLLQSLHKLSQVLPSTTQSLHKVQVLPSSTSYYKACRKYFPVVLLRTTKLAKTQKKTSHYACGARRGRSKTHKKTSHHAYGTRRGTSMVPGKIANFPQFLTIEPHFVRKGCAGQLEITICSSVFDDRSHFVIVRGSLREKRK